MSNKLYRGPEPTEVLYVHDYGIDVSKREIWLVPSDHYGYGCEEPVNEPGVDYSMATQFIKNLRMLVNISKDDPILIHQKTNGGDWHEGIAIYDAINHCPCHVTTLNYTHARSMSSLTFLAADKKVMMPHSTFMFHEGTHMFGGTTKQFQTEAENGKRATEQMVNIYVEVMMRDSKKWSGKTKAQCRNWLQKQMDKKEEVYLNPQEAIENGFADEIFDGNWEKLLDPVHD